MDSAPGPGHTGNAADDFPAIAKRLKELEDEAAKDRAKLPQWPADDSG